MLWARVCSRARQAPQGPGLSPATCAGAAPPPGSCRPRQRLHSPALCVSTPGGAAFRASPKPQPFPGPLPASGHAPHPAAGPGVPAAWSGNCLLPAVGQGDARVWHGTTTLSPDPFPLCTAGQWEAEGKADGKGRPATHSTLTPAAWSGPQLLAYQVASASLLTPLRDVAFGLETPDLQV